MFSFDEPPNHVRLYTTSDWQHEPYSVRARETLGLALLLLSFLLRCESQRLQPWTGDDDLPVHALVVHSKPSYNHFLVLLSTSVLPRPDSS